MTEERITENKMGTMPVGKLLLNMSWPAILSMLIQALYNIVDTIFVSFVGEQAIAAVTYIFPVSMLMISFSVGTGVGINSLIARRLGARRFDEADDAASHGFRLSFFNWAIFAIFGLFFATMFMKAFTETPYIIENGALYLKVTTIGSLFLMVQITNEKILQSTGNMIMPMICSLAGAVTNVILDPCFIFGLWIFPEMGVTGAAVATVIGQAVSMTLGLFLLFGHDHAVTIRFRGFKFKAEIIRDIYAVGLPAIIMQAIGSVMLFGLNAILGAISETGVAVLGVYQRLQSFVFMPVFGLTQGALPILGYNFGARNKERFMHAYKLALRVALTIMGLGFICFQLFPDLLLSIFNATDQMYEIGSKALRLISICFLPAAYGITTSTVFQATGHGILSLWSSLIRQLIGALPVAFVLSRFIGITGVWMAFPLAEAIGISYVICAFIWLYKREIKTMDIED